MVWVSLILFSCFFSLPVIAAESLTTTQTAVASPDISSSLIKVTGGLVLVIVAIFASAWFYRRFGNFSPVANEDLKIIGGLSLGQKEKVVLLQIGEEQLLVGVAPGSVQKIHILKKNIELKESRTKDNTAFADQLGEAISKWKNK